MGAPADFTVEDDAGAVVRLTGDWTATRVGEAPLRLDQTLAGLGDDVVLDLRRIGRMDTAGAYRLIQCARERITAGRVQARPETTRLLELIARALEDERPKPPKHWSFSDMMDRLGRGVIGVSREFAETMSFNGRLLAVTAKTIANPRRLRWASIVALAERAGLDAIPVIAVANFFVGAVLALLAANTLEEFGAQVFAVEAVGFGILREFNIVITAVLLAGRSASAFAAELGAMKMQQETDAMRVMGVDPFEALVLPRFLALLIMTPLLTLIATLAGLAGGCVVLWNTLGLSPQFFFQRVAEGVGILQFWVGLSKAPVMAIAIAAIGCRQGMETGGDVESLGRRVTAAVVHAVFSIILIDAVFALVYMELDI